MSGRSGDVGGPQESLDPDRGGEGSAAGATLPASGVGEQEARADAADLVASLLRTGPGKAYVLDPDDELAPPRGPIGATDLVDQLVRRLDRDRPDQTT